MSFEQKYLKYKKKYIYLKNQIGGDLCPVCNLEIVTDECKCKNVKISYYPRLAGNYSHFEKLGLHREELWNIQTVNPLEQLFRFDPLVLEEGVDFSFTPSPPEWIGPFEGGMTSRMANAKLLKNMSVTYKSNEKNLGVFKAGYAFRIIQYGSNEKVNYHKNMAVLIIDHIEKI
jgi:hypothetical protein